MSYPYLDRHKSGTQAKGQSTAENQVTEKQATKKRVTDKQVQVVGGRVVAAKEIMSAPPRFKKTVVQQASRAEAEYLARRVGDDTLICKECFREMAHFVFGPGLMENLKMPLDPDGFEERRMSLVSGWRLGFRFVSVRLVSVVLAGLRSEDYPFSDLLKKDHVVRVMEDLTGALETTLRDYFDNHKSHTCHVNTVLIFNTLLRLGSSGAAQNMLEKTLDYTTFIEPFDFDFERVLAEERARGALKVLPQHRGKRKSRRRRGGSTMVPCGL